MCLVDGPAVHVDKGKEIPFEHGFHDTTRPVNVIVRITQRIIGPHDLLPLCAQRGQRRCTHGLYTSTLVSDLSRFLTLSNVTRLESHPVGLL